jgi:uncharacterized protein (DUF2384 family)
LTPTLDEGEFRLTVLCHVNIIPALSAYSENGMEIRSDSAARMATQTWKEQRREYWSEIEDQALSVFGSKEVAEDWFNTPLAELRGLTPRTFFDEAPAQYREINDILTRIEYGVFS